MAQKVKSGSRKRSSTSTTVKQKKSQGQMSKKAQTRILLGPKKQKSLHQQKAQKQILKNRQTGTNSTGTVKKTIVSHPQEAQKQIPKNRQIGTKSSGTLKKIIVSHQHKAQKQIPKNRQTGTKPIGTVKKIIVSHQHKAQKQIPKNRQTGTKSTGTVKKIIVLHQQNAQKQIPKNRQTGNKSTATVKKIIVSHQHKAKNVPKNRQIGTKSAGTLKKTIVSHQHNSQKQVSNIRRAGAKVLSNFRKPRLSEQSSQTCENDHLVPQGTETSCTQSPASGTDICNDGIQLPTPSTSCLSHPVLASQMNGQMRNSAAVSPACMMPGPSRSQYQGFPGHPINTFIKSTAVAPAKIIPGTSRNRNEKNESRIGFDRGLEPLKIAKVAEMQGELYFMMKWKGCKMMDMVPAKIARQKCPLVVIQFYESHLMNVFSSSMA